MNTAINIADIGHRIARGNQEGQYLCTVKGRSFQELYALTENCKGKEYILSRTLLNDHYDIDAYLKDIHSQLNEGEYFIGCANHLRGYQTKVFKRRGLLTFIGIRQLAFFIHRVMPRLPLTGTIYRLFTGSKKARLSKTEILGRLSYAGFKIDQLRERNSTLYFRVERSVAKYADQSPEFGPIIRLRRMVQNGKMTDIYKLRTMHPYAQYMQDFVYEQNDLEEGGKFKDDFRISEEGRLFRKYFLDELPMLINLIKGDIKLVGVRPLSEHYFSLYTESMRRRRIKHRPGLLPPFYSESETPGSLEEIMLSETRYLIQYEKAPLKTDVKYLIRIIRNLIRTKLLNR